MKSNDRGFFSIDAVFAVTLLMMVTVSFLNIYQGRNQAAKLMGAEFEAKAVGEKLAATINTVYANGSNFELRINLPQKIENIDYSITFDNTKQEVIVALPSVGVTAKATVTYRNVSIGSLDLSKSIRIRWVGNNVEVANV